MCLKYSTSTYTTATPLRPVAVSRAQVVLGQAPIDRIGIGNIYLQCKYFILLIQKTN